MLQTVKQTVLDLLRIPQEAESCIKDFGDMTVILINGKSASFHLPGHILIRTSKANYPAYGIDSPVGRILVIKDDTVEDKITQEDLNFFSDAFDADLYDTMKQKEVTDYELFAPLGKILSNEPVSSDNGVAVYKTSIAGGTVYVREGSNRHKFISGKTDFLDDPYDFYVTRDNILSLDMLGLSAGKAGTSVEEFLYNRITENPIRSTVSLLKDKDIAYTIKQALDMRKLKFSFSEETFWECLDPERGVSRFSSIDWDKVRTTLVNAKDTPDGYEEIATLVNVQSGGWGDYNIAIFFTYLLLIEQETADFIQKAFKLNLEEAQ